MWKELVAVLVVTGILDAVYLTARYDYHSAIFKGIQKEPMNVRIAAVPIVYILFAIALSLWALRGATSVKDAALRGALVGFLMYGFYDSTNYATLTNFTLPMALGDTLWGTVLGGAGAAGAYYILKKL